MFAITHIDTQKKDTKKQQHRVPYIETEMEKTGEIKLLTVSRMHFAMTLACSTMISDQKCLLN